MALLYTNLCWFCTFTLGFFKKMILIVKSMAKHFLNISHLVVKEEKGWVI